MGSPIEAPGLNPATLVCALRRRTFFSTDFKQDALTVILCQEMGRFEEGTEGH